MASRRHTDQGNVRKQQLLDCAADLFSTRGYAATRIADICAAAGVAKGLFYWYFENKEALFAELVASMRQRLRKAQADAMDPAADALSRLRQGAEASVRFMARHAGYFALLEVESHDRQVSALLRQGADVHTADSARLVKEAMAEGLIPDGHEPDLLALGVIGAVAHFGHIQRSGRIPMDVDELAVFVGEWVVAALSGPR
jgi:AcrR family transcriptional regulator